MNANKTLILYYFNIPTKTGLYGKALHLHPISVPSRGDWSIPSHHPAREERRHYYMETSQQGKGEARITAASLCLPCLNTSHTGQAAGLSTPPQPSCSSETEMTLTFPPWHGRRKPHEGKLGWLPSRLITWPKKSPLTVGQEKTE